MLSLPAYKHDHPDLASGHNDDGSSRSTRQSANKIKSVTKVVPTVPFSMTALDEAVKSETPTIFQLDCFNAGDFLIALNKFAHQDQHTYCTSNGAHNSEGLKLRQVFTMSSTTNAHRIEDGIYPEKALPALGVTELLNTACPPNCGLLQAWLHAKAYIDNTYAKDGYDPETRAILVVTGNVSGFRATTKEGGVWIDNTGQRVPPHFDEYAGLGFLGQGEKDFMLCSPLGLDVKIPTNGLGNPNERHDVDPFFCDSGVWHIAKLKPGQMLYVPTAWWHQVTCTCLRSLLPSPPCGCVLETCVQ
jgi:hypothetical protein